MLDRGVVGSDSSPLITSDAKYMAFQGGGTRLLRRYIVAVLVLLP